MTRLALGRAQDRMERKARMKTAGGPKPPTQGPGLRPVAENRVASPETVSAPKKGKGEKAGGASGGTTASNKSVPSFMQPTSNSALRQRSMKERAIFEQKQKLVIPKTKKKKKDDPKKKKVIRMPSTYRRVKKSASIKSMKPMTSLKRMSSIKLLKRALSKGRQEGPELPISTRASLASIEEGADEPRKSPSPVQGNFVSDEPPTKMLEHSASSVKRRIESLAAPTSDHDNQILDEHAEGQGFGEEISGSDEDETFEKPTGAQSAFPRTGGSSLVRSRNVRQREASSSDEEILEAVAEQNEVNQEAGTFNNLPAIESDLRDPDKLLKPDLDSKVDTSSSIVDSEVYTGGMDLGTDSCELKPEGFGSLQLISSLDSTDQPELSNHTTLAEQPPSVEAHVCMEDGRMNSGTDAPQQLQGNGTSWDKDKSDFKKEEIGVESPRMGNNSDIMGYTSEALELDSAVDASLDDESKIQGMTEQLLDKDESFNDGLALRTEMIRDSLEDRSTQQADSVIVEYELGQNMPVSEGIEQMNEVILPDRIDEVDDKVPSCKDNSETDVFEPAENGDYKIKDGESIKIEDRDVALHDRTDGAFFEDNEYTISHALAYPEGVNDAEGMLLGDQKEVEVGNPSQSDASDDSQLQECKMPPESGESARDGIDSPTKLLSHVQGSEALVEASSTNLLPIHGTELEGTDETILGENKVIGHENTASKTVHQDEDRSLLPNLDDSPEFVADKSTPNPNLVDITSDLPEQQGSLTVGASVKSDVQLDQTVLESQCNNSLKETRISSTAVPGAFIIQDQNGAEGDACNLKEQMVLNEPLEQQYGITPSKFESNLNTQVEEGLAQAQERIDGTGKGLPDAQNPQDSDLGSPTTVPHLPEIMTDKSSLEIYEHESTIRRSEIAQSMSSVTQRSREVVLPFVPPRRQARKESGRGFWWELGVGIVAGVLTAAWLAFTRGCDGCGQESLNDIELEPLLEVSDVPEPVFVAPDMVESMPKPDLIHVPEQVPQKVVKFDDLQEKFLWHSE